jgi:hypothetical protein
MPYITMKNVKTDAQTYLNFDKRVPERMLGHWAYQFLQLSDNDVLSSVFSSRG